MEFKFKKDFPDVEIRRRECEKTRNQFANKIPIVCEKNPKATKLGDISKTKFLVPNDLAISQFMFMIRKRIEIDEKAALFLLADGKFLLSGDANVNDIYERHKDKDDGFLYIVYTDELIWGNN